MTRCTIITMIKKGRVTGENKTGWKKEIKGWEGEGVRKSVEKSFAEWCKLRGLIALYFRRALSAFSYLHGCSQTFIFTLVKPSPHSFPPSRVSFLRYTRGKVALSVASFNRRWPSLVSRTLSTLKTPFPRSRNLFHLSDYVSGL